MKKFYTWPLGVQWILSILLLAGGLLVFIPVVSTSYGLLLIPFVAPFLNLSSVPFFRLTGYYKYLNPYVISTVQNDKYYDLHNIFTFDYLIHFSWSDRGRHVQRTLLSHYIKALLTIIHRIENNQLSPEVKIVGHSYFFNDRTAEKFGFTVQKASLFWTLNSIFQCIELTYLYSFSRGKWSVPPFWKVKRAEISGSDLVTKKEILKLWSRKIEPETQES